MNPQDLKNIGIVPWTDIKAQYNGSDILLGNGFSVNLTGVFGYGTLFSQFLKTCSPSDQKVLASFNTSNFEFILEDLAIATRVNSAMGLPYKPVSEIASRVREGLIKTIELVHPRKQSVDWTRLAKVANELNDFGDIYTLNYDALLYHVIMLCKDRYVAGGSWRRYNDYFWNKISPEYLQFMEFQNYKPYNHVYYLHGALFLFKLENRETLEEMDVKLCTASSAELLDAIASELRGGTLPLFVSEGRPEEKKRAISRSEYLRFSNAALAHSRDTLVIFGASLSDQDAHIADAISGGTDSAAVAVYPLNKSKVQLNQEMNLMKARLPAVTVQFFDSRTLFS